MMVSVLVTTVDPDYQACEGPDGDLDCCFDAQHGHCDCWYAEYIPCCQCGRVLGPVVLVRQWQ